MKTEFTERLPNQRLINRAWLITRDAISPFNIWVTGVAVRHRPSTSECVAHYVKNVPREHLDQLGVQQEEDWQV